VLLLDEPLGALDLKLRKEMQVELKRIQQQVGLTFVYVTHDQDEALTMSDTVVVMNHGNLQQVGTPMDIYNEPINAFVADFIGESNILSGVMHRDYYVEFAGRHWECVDVGFDPMQRVDVVIRPEDITLVDPDGARITAVVDSTTFKGVHYEMILDQNGTKWMVHSTQSRKPGEKVGLYLTPEDLHIMDKPEEFDHPESATREADLPAPEPVEEEE
jgi:spermidine/putrescine transport system ATP-binding protein